MFLSTLALFFSFSLSAQTVAVLDTGIELDHPVWNERLDCESSESCGHDFTTNKPLSLADSRGDIWPTDVYKYYWIRTRRSFDTWSVAEEKWYLNIRRNAQFMKVQGEFSGHNHGTHVSAIALNGPIINPQADSDLPIPLEYQVKESEPRKPFKLLPIKYLGDDEAWPAPSSPKYDLTTPLEERELGFATFLKSYQKWQLERIARAISYAAKNKNVRVVNGSFGKSFKSTVTQIETWLNKASLNKNSATQKATALLTNLNKKVKPLLESYPHILFTFSAGNSDENVDQMIHFPSGANAINSVSVGASLWYSERAYFSNYGQNSVDLFAPGLAILSAAVSNHTLPINGTSQAAPYVAHLALKLSHPALPAEDIKKLILATVDKKADLQSTSSAGGIINSGRALLAQSLYLKSGNLEEAVTMAKKRIPDQNNSKTPSKQLRLKGAVEKLPELF